MQTLNIEWRHLVKDGNTCFRCSDTGEALDSMINQLNQECQASGWEIRFIEIPLGAGDIDQSNMILINGVPIEDILPGAKSASSHCASCCEFTGRFTECRTVEFGGNRYEAIPEALIRSAVCSVADCC